ncbi:Copia protein, partial [Trachymyrmex septentrionalis]
AAKNVFRYPKGTNIGILYDGTKGFSDSDYVGDLDTRHSTTDYLKQLLRDGDYKCEKAIIIRVDNQSAIKLVCNPEYHKRCKHTDIRHHFVREKCSDRNIDIEYACSQNQLADILTKVLSRDLFRNL